jgi:hypothetical protein
MPGPSAVRTDWSIDAAQRAMRDAYLDGAPGVLVSGSVWCLAALDCLWRSPQQAIWTFFIGGMLIHPLSLLLLKALRRPARHASDNPLGALALSGTLWMVASLPLVYGASLLHIGWFYPAMLLVIGGRYLTFSTLYGRRLYWALGAVLLLAAWTLALLKAAPALGAFSGAAIEACFGLALLRTARQAPALTATGNQA